MPYPRWQRDPLQRLHPAVQAFLDPVDMLAAIDPLLALAALDPSAALVALSPALRMLSPAVNPSAALLAFNPQAAPALAISNPVPFGLVSVPRGAVGQPFGVSAPAAVRTPWPVPL